MTEWISVGQQRNLCLWCVHFSQSASTLNSGDTDLTEFWQKRQENIINANLSGVSRQRIGCECVCAVVGYQVN